MTLPQASFPPYLGRLEGNATCHTPHLCASCLPGQQAPRGYGHLPSVTTADLAIRCCWCRSVHGRESLMLTIMCLPLEAVPALPRQSHSLRSPAQRQTRGYEPRAGAPQHTVESPWRGQPLTISFTPLPASSGAGERDVCLVDGCVPQPADNGRKLRRGEGAKMRSLSLITARYAAHEV